MQNKSEWTEHEQDLLPWVRLLEWTSRMEPTSNGSKEQIEWKLCSQSCYILLYSDNTHLKKAKEQNMLHYLQKKVNLKIFIK